MITPVLIQIIYWILTVVVILAGLAALIGSDDVGGRLAGLLTLALGPLAIRIFPEVFILVFKMNETLTDIKDNTRAAPIGIASALAKADDLVDQPPGNPRGEFCASCGNSLPAGARFCANCGSAT